MILQSYSDFHDTSKKCHSWSMNELPKLSPGLYTAVVYPVDSTMLRGCHAPVVLTARTAFKSSCTSCHSTHSTILYSVVGISHVVLHKPVIIVLFSSLQEVALVYIFKVMHTLCTCCFCYLLSESVDVEAYLSLLVVRLLSGYCLQICGSIKQLDNEAKFHLTHKNIDTSLKMDIEREISVRYQLV